MSHEHHHEKNCCEHGQCHCHCHDNDHSHGHHHEHGSHGKLATIIVAAVLLGVAVYIEHTFNLPLWQLLLIYLVPYLIVGHETLKEAAEGLLHGEALSEDFLMSIATLGALAIGFLPGAENQFPEAVFVMLFFQIGELFEGYAEGKSRESISHLMDIRPDVANVEREGTVSTVTPDSIEVGEIIVIRPGEKIPLDGVIVEGSSSLNTVALTGESAPREVTVEDEIISGCVNLSGVLRVRTTKSFGESTVSKIINLVENASESKSKSENFISRFARVYTPIVVIGAALVAVLPPLLGFGSFSTWVLRALTFLVVSCPCALVISVPLTFFGGIGGASRKGILIKGSSYMDTLAKVGTVVFDKTGTLTKGVFMVSAVHSKGHETNEQDEHHLLHLAAHVEHFSTHPIAAALREAFPCEHDDCVTTDVKEIAGHGIEAVVNGQKVAVGNKKMMRTCIENLDESLLECEHVGTIIHVAVDGEYAGHIVISDQAKDDAQEAVSALKKAGVERTVMLTGDREEVAANVAQRLGLDEYYAELLPTDKVAHVERLLESAKAQRNPRLAFVGDGINDAPVLARADVGIAMGGLGSDAAIEAADIVLMDDQPSKIATAIAIAKRTLRIASQNTWFAIGVKVAVLVLATFGLATMWMAVFADVGVCVLAVLNAMRALRIKD